MNEPSKNGRSPSDNPRDYSLPREVSLDLPDEAPDGIDTTTTIHDYSDRDVDDINPDPYTDHFGDTLEARAVAVFAEHSGRTIHPQELAHRAGIDYDDVPALIEELTAKDVIRHAHTTDNVPHYQLNQLSDIGFRIKAIAS